MLYNVKYPHLHLFYFSVERRCHLHVHGLSPTYAPPKIFLFYVQWIGLWIWVVNILKLIWSLCLIQIIVIIHIFFINLFNITCTFISRSFHLFKFAVLVSLHSCDACNKIYGDCGSCSCRSLFFPVRIWIMFVNTNTVDLKSYWTLLFSSESVHNLWNLQICHHWKTFTLITYWKFIGQFKLRNYMKEVCTSA